MKTGNKKNDCYENKYWANEFTFFENIIISDYLVYFSVDVIVSEYRRDALIFFEKYIAYEQ